MRTNLNEEGILTGIIKFMSEKGFDSASSFLSDISNKISGGNLNGSIINGNIAKSAAGLTATFPVIVTEATSLENATMIAKAVERNAVSMLQMLFAANQITSVTNAKAYLNKFHNNISNDLDLSDMGVDDIIEYSNKISESADDDLVYFASVNKAIKAVCEDLKNNKEYGMVLEENLNDISLNDYRIKTVFNEMQVSQSRSRQTRTTYGGGLFGNIPTNRETIETNSDDPGMADLNKAYDTLSKGVIKTDVQKANEAVPSLMIVNFVSLIDNQKVVSTAVIGVKARIHYVPSQEMVDRIILKNADRRGLFNFIRATTGEIKFFKDFLFAVDRAKIDAIAKSGKGSNSKIWKILELRADRAKLNKSAGRNGVNCAAITTIVISKAEADLIKKAHRIDITKPGTLLAIMRGYNLMCAVIVDDVAERVDMLYDDGSKKFDTISFTSLERDNGDAQLKKVINIMATKGR